MEMKTPELQSTRVLVTGGTSGLGLAMAEALVNAGVRVVLTSRDRARAEAAAAAIGAVGIEMDVRDERSVDAGVQAAYGRLGGVDVLIANAGIGMRTVNPRFLTDPSRSGRSLPTAFAMWSRPRSPARFWSRAQWLRGCSRPVAAGS